MKISTKKSLTLIGRLTVFKEQPSSISWFLIPQNLLKENTQEDIFWGSNLDDDMVKRS
jgi:hypothetical protein